MRRVRRVFFRLAAPEGFWAGCLDLTHTNSGSLHQRGRLTRLYHRLSWQNYARRGAGCQLDDVYARNVCAGNSQLAFVWGRGGTTRATGSWNRRRLLRVVSPGVPRPGARQNGRGGARTPHTRPDRFIPNGIGQRWSRNLSGLQTPSGGRGARTPHTGRRRRHICPRRTAAAGWPELDLSNLGDLTNLLSDLLGDLLDRYCPHPPNCAHSTSPPTNPGGRWWGCRAVWP